ncbi:MAG: O13/O129/O135 family O-antigen flippase [Isosphaeraceae bacterium]
MLARNALGNIISQCLPMTVAIVTLPWMIRGLGTDRYGVMTLSWMVLGYFSLFDLGLGRALTKMVAEKLGRGEEREVAGLVWTAMSLMTALGLAGSLLVVLVTPWLVDGALRIVGPLRGEALGAFYLTASALPFVIGTCGLRGVMEAHQRLGAANVARTCTSLSILIGPLALLPFTRNLAAIVALVCAARMVSWSLHAWLCLRTVPEMRRGFVLRADLVRPLASFGGWMTAVNVINPIMVQMDRFLVGALVSLAAVAYYTTPFELITKGWFLSSAVLGVMFPAFATSYAFDRRATVGIFEKCLRYVSLILFPIALVGVALGHEILTLWLGADFASQSTRVMQWLALGVFLNGLAQVPSALMQGIGRPDLTFKIHLLELPFYLVAAWWLIGTYGIEGAAVAWAARTALDLALYFVAVGQVLPGSGASARRASVGVAAAVMALAAAALPFGLVYRGSVLAAALAGFAVIAWSRLLTARERQALLALTVSARNKIAPGRAMVVATAVAESSEPLLMTRA